MVFVDERDQALLDVVDSPEEDGAGEAGREPAAAAAPPLPAAPLLGQDRLGQRLRLATIDNFQARSDCCCPPSVGALV